MKLLKFVVLWMPRLEWTDNYAMSVVSNERRQPLGINDINKKANSTTTRGEKPICVDRKGFNV
jgi:hypothetical protein